MSNKKQQDLEKRIERLEAALREAQIGFEALHSCALKNFTEDAVLYCVHHKGVIDRVLNNI